MTRAKILLAICGLFLLPNCGDGDSNLEPNRVISVDGDSNFRDFGGYPTASGKTVKWRQLYRSSNLSKLTDTGLETFKLLGIRMIINLRKQSEVDSDPDRFPQGVDWQNIALEESSIGDVLMRALQTGDTSGLELDKLIQSYGDFHISNVEQYGELLPLVMYWDNAPSIYIAQEEPRAPVLQSSSFSSYWG